jgi:hypothetical protein
MTRALSERQRLWILFIQLSVPHSFRSAALFLAVLVVTQIGGLSGLLHVVAFVVLVAVLFVRPSSILEEGSAERFEALSAVRHRLFHVGEGSEPSRRPSDETTIDAEQVQAALLSALHEIEPPVADDDAAPREML